MSTKKRQTPSASVLANKLDALLAEVATSGLQQPDEFTSRQFYDRAKQSSPAITLSGVRGRLGRMVNEGKLLARTIVIGGKITSVFRFPG